MSGRYFEERLLCWATASVARPTCLSIELPTLSWQEGRIRRPHVSLVPLCSCRAQHGCQVDYVTSHVSKKSKSQESRRNIKNTDINRRKLQKSWKTLKRQAFVQKTYKITPKGRNLATFLPWFSNSNVNASTEESTYIYIYIYIYIYKNECNINFNSASRVTPTSSKWPQLWMPQPASEEQ